MAAPHGDPRAWTREQVNQWIAHKGGPQMDHGLEGPELCRMGRSWFRGKFPGVGQELCDDLRHRRKVIENERMFGDKRTADKRVVEGTRAAFLVMAYQICMIFYLLGKENLMQKASKVLNHLYQLVDVVKRRAASKDKVDPALFREGRMKDSIKNRTALDSTQVSLVLGSKCIAVADKTYNKVITALSEAMEVVGATLTIKIKMAFWKKALFIGGAAAVVGLTAGVGAVAVGATWGAGVVIGGTAALVTATALAAADSAENELLIAAYEIFLEKEQRTVEFTSNYLRAVLLTTKIMDRGSMSESELGSIIASVEQESRESVIQTVEEELMKRLPSHLRRRLKENLLDVRRGANFEYRATAWLHDDSVKDVNDSISIALLQFGMRNLVRDVFILGVIGPEDKSKKELMKSAFPNAAHSLEQMSCDIVLYNGYESTGQTVPVLLLPSGENAATKATRGLWTRSCSAFICVLDYMYTSDTPDLRELNEVAGLCVPVLLCINTKGTITSQGEADRAIERYKSRVSWSLRDLVQVVLVDVSDTHRPEHGSMCSIPDKSPWITGGGDVKYWVQDVLDHHQEHAYSIDKDFKDSL
ncbi:uncharacterized protein LOC144862577 [Branchiostoma floridae x Branchiostoma japonicum]